MAKEETPVAFCVAAAAPPESGGSAGVRTAAAARPTLLPRMFQCAVKILIGVLACCILSAAPESDVTRAKKGIILPGSPLVWVMVPLGMYACFLWEIIRVSKIKEKTDE